MKPVWGDLKYASGQAIIKKMIGKKCIDKISGHR